MKRHAAVVPEGNEAPDTSPLLSVKGVGPARVRLLSRLGIESVDDALHHLPRSYEDRRLKKPISALTEGEPAAARGVVESAAVLHGGGGRRRFEVTLSDGSGILKACWYSFRGLPQSPDFRKGSRLWLYGTFRKRGKSLEVIHPEAACDDPSLGTPPAFDALVPVYPSTEGLSQKILRKIMRDVVSLGLSSAGEILPPEMLESLGLPGKEESLRALHFPDGETAVDELGSRRTPWHRRLIFEELFLLQLGIARIRAHGRDRPKKYRCALPDYPLLSLEKSLPFRLTEAQKRVCLEVAGDMASPRVMSRLLQGDVGSGKTVVAAMACLLGARSGYQAAVMAPTEILAEQLYVSLRSFTEPFGVKTALLSSSRSPREKASVTRGLEEGEIGVAVGTHALIQEGVRFSRLGLAVIDEQQRFGVRQRTALLEKGNHPDMLAMTATPIPRTLALTLYGDCDYSLLDEMPAGRRPVETFLAGEATRSRVYEVAERELADGNRVFVVLPLIDGGGKEGLKAVRDTADLLKRQVLPGWGIGLLHGRMSLEERVETMERFRSGEVSVLVATTVVEVGIDVPEATVMIVEHAERFGLAQLHQLRGRIGRGAKPSTCFLMAGRATGEDAKRRLDVLTSTADGFRIAEEDLRIRGPGEFFGARQSGLPKLRVADLLRDQRILESARKEALKVIAKDRPLRLPEHRRLREAVDSRWKERIFLAVAE